MRREPVRLVVALGAALCAIGASSSASADVPRIAIVVATRVNVTEVQADALASRLAEALRAQLEIDVIAGAQVRRRLPPAGVADDCVARQDCLRDVATRLDGDELLFLFLARIGPRVQIDVTWADPDIGSVASRAALVVDENAATGNSDATSVFAGASSRLLPHASPRQRRSEPRAPLIVSSRTEEERGRRITAPAVVAGAAAAVALATGVGFAVAAREDYKSLEEDDCHRENCPGANGRIDQMERRALVADILFATAGVAAATGLIFYLSSGEDEPNIQVGAGAEGAVVSFGGTF